MNEKYFLIIGVIIVLGLIAFFYLKKSRCPICKKFLTLHSTGITKLETYTKKESEYRPEKRMTYHHTNTYQKIITHYKCSSCGYTYDQKSDMLIDRKSSI